MPIPRLQHRVETTLTWVDKLIRFAPIGSIIQELVRFDLQQIENAPIAALKTCHYRWNTFTHGQKVVATGSLICV